MLTFENLSYKTLHIDPLMVACIKEFTSGNRNYVQLSLLSGDIVNVWDDDRSATIQINRAKDVLLGYYKSNTHRVVPGLKR